MAVINREREYLPELARVQDFIVYEDGEVIDAQGSGGHQVDPKLSLHWALETVLLAVRKGVSPTSWPNPTLGVREEGLGVIMDNIATLERVAKIPRAFGAPLALTARNAIATLVDYGTPRQKEEGYFRLTRLETIQSRTR